MFIILPGRGNREVNQIVFVLFVFGLFIASAVVSCNEVRYTLGGRTQDATVEKIFKVTHLGDTDDSGARISVQYIIDDGGNKRHETDEVAMDWFEERRDSLLNEAGTTMAVQYLAGSEDSSRIAGHTRRWVMIPFGLAMAALAFVTIRFWRDFSAHQRRLAEGD